jgi:hypothetical protein
MKRVSLVILLSSLCAVQALAETYVRVEKDGTKTYSDRPLPGGQPVEIQPAQTYSAPSPSASGSNSRVPREQQLLQEMTDFRYDRCELTPKSEATFQNPESVTVGARLVPGLRPGDVIDFRIDGTAVPGNRLSFVMPQPFRGAHTATIQIKDRYGKTLCSTNTTFNVFRASLNSPARK